MELGIGRGAERLERQDRRGGVVAVRVRRLGRKARDDDVGPEAADDPDHVGEHRVLAPDAQRLLGALRVAEVARAGEELLGAVDAARGQQLLRADEAERRPLLGADQVLAAVAAREREVGRAHLRAVGEVGEQRRVLVVGVGGDVEHAADDAQLAQAERDLGGVRLRRRTGREGGSGRHGGRDETGKDTGEGAGRMERSADGRRRCERV